MVRTSIDVRWVQNKRRCFQVIADEHEQKPSSLSICRNEAKTQAASAPSMETTIDPRSTRLPSCLDQTRFHASDPKNHDDHHVSLAVHAGSTTRREHRNILSRERSSSRDTAYSSQCRRIVCTPSVHDQNNESAWIKGIVGTRHSAYSHRKRSKPRCF